MTHWKALLLVYRRIDVRLDSNWFRGKRFTHALSEEEIRDGIESFRSFPQLAYDLSNGEAGVSYEIEMVERPLTSLTPTDDRRFWPSPDDTRDELDLRAPDGHFDSVFMLWPQKDLTRGDEIPCSGWGLGMGSSEWTNEATYAVVANAPTWTWRIPIVGEVWLHEWLHGVCQDCTEKGFVMPEYDADGGGSHGYVQHEMTGWTEFYRDLMTGNVLENGERKGITPEAWRSRGTSTDTAAR